MNIFKPFFLSRGKFSPVYFYVTLLMLFVFIMLGMRLFGVGNFSDMLIIGILGMVVGWLAVFSVDRKNGNQPPVPPIVP